MASNLLTSYEDPRGVRVVELDTPHAPHNQLCGTLAEDLNRLLDEIDGHSPSGGVVFVSAKPHSFVTGTDLDELESCGRSEEVTARIATYQRLLTRIDRLPRTVAAIHGPASGGGLALALACRAMILSDHANTALCFPEVTIGLLPLAGGCWRLPARIGPSAALTHILSGRPIDAIEAARIGLAIDVVSHESLVERAILRLADPCDLPRKRSRAGRAWWLRIAERTKFGRRAIYASALKAISGHTAAHYPAPLACLRAVEAGCEEGREVSEQLEREKIGELIFGETSRSLRYLSRLRREGLEGPAPYAQRLLYAWLAEALRLLVETRKPARLERAFGELGFSVGPLWLCDEIGLDQLNATSMELADSVGKRFAAPDVVRQLVDAGRTGRETGRGFYRHDGSDATLDPAVGELLPAGDGADISAEKMARRGLWAVIVEAMRCLEEAVIPDTETGDIGAVLGMGFPPFMGGPFHHVEATGREAAHALLDELAVNYGERFRPPDIMQV